MNKFYQKDIYTIQQFQYKKEPKYQWTIKFFEQMKSLEGVRLPGERRHKNRLDTGSRSINTELVNIIISLSIK